jgi:hypothetical protein
MFGFFRRLIQRYGFFKRETVSLGPDESIWSEHGFYKQGTAGLAWERMNSPAALKAKRLAQIARERAWVYANKDELLAKRKGFYVRLRALKNAEMAVEQGKPEPGK